MTVCPCNPEKEYDQCCGPYLAGEKIPPTAEALMRSRYTAYAKNDYGYVIRTNHPSTRPSEKDFTDEVKIDWQGLDILATEAGGEEDRDGEVEFVARYKVSGRQMQQHERSQFLKEDGQWFYLDGDFVKPPQAHSEKVGRNEPCPCGSGKKFKKCCYK
ncbi:MAG TPA: YchJ family metal-binding protein [Desulfurivibrionaceae bacterium]|nr:YchJ family metal-binding protein [Desulfurivibrionaceae bacterium]